MLEKAREQMGTLRSTLVTVPGSEPLVELCDSILEELRNAQFKFDENVDLIDDYAEELRKTREGTDIQTFVDEIERLKVENESLKANSNPFPEEHEEMEIEYDLLVAKLQSVMSDIQVSAPQVEIDYDLLASKIEVPQQEVVCDTDAIVKALSDDNINAEIFRSLLGIQKTLNQTGVTNKQLVKDVTECKNYLSSNTEAVKTLSSNVKSLNKVTEMYSKEYSEVCEASSTLEGRIEEVVSEQEDMREDINEHETILSKLKGIFGHVQ